MIDCFSSSRALQKNNKIKSFDHDDDIKFSLKEWKVQQPQNAMIQQVTQTTREEFKR